LITAAPTPAFFVVRAGQGPFGSAEWASLRYWNAATCEWGDYDSATRYGFPNPATPQGPLPTSTTEAVPAYPQDAEGFPYHVDEHIGAIRKTHCCGAATSCNDMGFYCKSCFHETSFVYELPARLDLVDQATAAGRATIACR